MFANRFVLEAPRPILESASRTKSEILTGTFRTKIHPVDCPHRSLTHAGSTMCALRNHSC
jgi:hypothetical protein